MHPHQASILEIKKYEIKNIKLKPRVLNNGGIQVKKKIGLNNIIEVHIINQHHLQNYIDGYAKLSTCPL